MDFSALSKNLKKDFSAFPKIRLAILGDTPTQLLQQAIRGYGYTAGIDFEIYEADYDQIDRQIFETGSELYEFKPEFVLIFQAAQKLLNKFYKKKEGKAHFAEQQTEYMRNLCETLNNNLNTRIVYCNFPEIPDAVFGSYANKTELSSTYQFRKLNMGLMELASSVKNLFINDLSSLQNMLGRQNIYSPSTYTNTGIAYDLEFWPLFAKNTVDIILAINGKQLRKALILDLDNTLWGGIVGDDGIENIQIGDLGTGKAFTEFQLWLKQLKQRGIILTVCSKNYEHIAKEVFEKHPDMVLRPDDIAVFVANWENKVDNIRYIQSILNIGFDSMVYLDDNPFERNMVRKEIPDMVIPELPEDPAEYLPYLYTLNLFETASLSEEDENRTKQYQEEAKRATLQHTYANEDEFLGSLEMVSIVKPFDKFYTPRIAQLSQRSNQFNLRTVRYTEQDIQKIISDPGYLSLYFTLEDKFGEYGLINLIILEKKPGYLFIDTWLMSCRVLKRGMEDFVLNNIIRLAKENNFTIIAGEYIPTEKNELVKEHYQKLGFIQKNGLWEMDVHAFEERKTFIKTAQ